MQPGDSLSAIAARFGIQGGWPPLYASNLKVIGWNPDVLHPGAVLVLPGPARARYTITAGDTLSRIAAGLGIAGGWPALYAANRQVIGANPDALQPGTVLRLPRPRGRAPLRGDAQHAPRTTACARAAACAGAGEASPAPGDRGGTGGGGDAGVAEDHAGRAGPAHPGGAGDRAGAGRLAAAAENRPPSRAGPAASRPGRAAAARPAGQLRPAPAAPGTASIVLADHDRLVVTCNKTDETVYVLRPPGEDPRAILRVARLVLPEGRYWELARQLGVPAVEPVE